MASSSFGPSSEQASSFFVRSVRLANDTSIGAGFAPMSDLEKVVAAVARLNARDVKAAGPEVGEDIKVMGIRLGGRIRRSPALSWGGS
jgi:S-adenosylmethionine synthetase